MNYLASAVLASVAACLLPIPAFAQAAGAGTKGSATTVKPAQAVATPPSPPPPPPPGPPTPSPPLFAPTNLRYLVGTGIVADSKVAPADATCWRVTKQPQTYQLLNSSPPCLTAISPSLLTKSSFGASADRGIILDGSAAPGDAYYLTPSGMKTGADLVAMSSSIDGMLVAAGGTIRQVQKFEFPPPAFAPKNLRYLAGFVADSPAPPAPDDPCWTKVKDQPQTYRLSNSSGFCLANAPLLSSAPKSSLGIDEDDVITVNGSTAPGDLYFLTATGEKTAAQLTATPAIARASEFNGMLIARGGTVSQVTKLESSRRAANACPWPTSKNLGGDALVEIDLTTMSVVSAPPYNVIRPNQGVTVNVCHDASEAPITIALGGTRGLVAPGANNPTVAEDSHSSNQLVLAPNPKKVIETRFTPRQPGTADVTVTWGSTANPTTYNLELQVDTLYWGAVRFGLGTSIADWNGYQIATFAGSAQPEIRSAHTQVAFDLVNGFAPYLFDFMFCAGHGGRSETVGCNARVAPFIGYGLLGASSQGIQALSSIHLGFEFEFASNFSVAANFVMRRTQGLAQGYQPGSPVPVTTTIDDVTRDTWQPGFAFVVNASPSFLQFATATGGGGNNGGNTKK